MIRVALPLLIAMAAAPLHAQNLLGAWPQHSRERPHPPVQAPAPIAPVMAPADAISLFDGTSLAKWTHADSTSAKWRIVDGAFEVVPNTGTLTTRDTFGDVHLHIEWMSPSPAVGKDQDRGNSGVFFGGSYEVQILDSYQNDTYADGQAASIYGQYPPLVNASRPPGQWQSYDIVYHRPRFDAAGKVLSPARFSVTHNGIEVQKDVALVGPTSNGSRMPYVAHPDRMPISLQDHGHRVRFRNIWLHNLE